MNKNARTRLSVISGGATQESPAQAIGGPAAATATAAAPAAPASARARRRPTACRPTDALEPWRIPVTPQLRRLAKKAGALGLALDTAAAVVVERSLVIREHALEAVLLEVDHRAAVSAVQRPLSAASAAYLRTLSCGGAARPKVQGPKVILALPARLNDRIGSLDALCDLVEPDTLATALDWERAAVAGGWTLTEWAVGEALALRA
jgi:hypothetical protein